MITRKSSPPPKTTRETFLGPQRRPGCSLPCPQPMGWGWDLLLVPSPAGPEPWALPAGCGVGLGG